MLPSPLLRATNATESSHYYTSQRLNAAFITRGLRKPNGKAKIGKLEIAFSQKMTHFLKVHV